MNNSSDINLLHRPAKNIKGNRTYSKNSNYKLMES